MSTRPVVSILIPVYNRESLIGAALDSAINQTYTNLEIIVGDNHSTDQTFEIVREYARRDPRMQCFRNAENLGPVRNWQECLAHSTGDWIKFLFSDDWLAPDAVEQLLMPLLEYPEAGFSYSAVEIHDDGQSHREYQWEQSGLMASSEFMGGYLTGHPSVPVSPGAALFRRCDIERAFTIPIPDRFGLHCAERGIGPDLWFFLHACEAHPQVYHITKVLSHFRAHQGSISVLHGDSFNRFCYDVTFAGFLASSHLPASEKSRLNALLLLRMSNPYRLRQLRCYNVFRAYASLFPDTYDRWNVNLFSRDVITLLGSKIKEFVHLPGKNASRQG